MAVNTPNNSNMKYWLPVFLAMILIFSVSSVPGNNIPSVFPLQDIVFHSGIYLILAFFFSNALKNTYPDALKSKIVLTAILFGIFYGLTDEFHQSFVPLRTCSLSDLFVDAIGSVLGSLGFAARKIIFNTLKLSQGAFDD